MIDWTTVILASIGVLGTAISGVLAILLAKVTKTLDQVHVAVNSERTSALKEIRALKKVILKMSIAKATKDEQETPTVES